jgi:hypothetical protein
MEIWVSDAEAQGELIGLLRAAGYLVVRRSTDTIEAQPLNSVSERFDRSRLEQYLREWRADHRGVLVELRT